MKSIAEYFRDLAADDRYFGAEPPTPDPVMLHKIAEREIQRRVEAKVQENGVILRADDRPDDRAMPRVTMPAAPAVTPAPIAAPKLDSVADTGPAVESAAARLSRLRAAQTQAVQTQAAAPVVTIVAAPVSPLGDISSRFADVEAYAEDQDAETAAVVVPALAPVAVLAEPAPVVADVVAEGAAHLAPIAADPVAEPILIPADDVVEPIQPDDSLLSAIADQVADEPVLDMADLDVPQPDMAEPAAIIDTWEPTPADTAVADVLAALRDEPAVEPVAALAAGPADSHDVLAALRETLAGMTAQDDQLAADIAMASEGGPSYDLTTDDLPSYDLTADDLTADDLPDGEQDDFALHPVADDEIDLGDLMKLDGLPEGEAAPLDADAEPSDAPLINAAADLDTSADQPMVDSTDAQTIVVVEKADRARARVIKIRRLDKKAATLTPEAEADLQNTLAALSAEIDPTPEPTPAAEAVAPVADQIDIPAAAVVSADPSVEALLDAELAADMPAPELVAADPVAADPVPTDLPTIDPTKIAAADDAAVDRLLAQTNSQFDVPEVKRRRSAIAHLKAAVLATVADRKSNPNAASKGTEVRMDPYRKDLDQAVRPSAPVERPAPLVLVSAQRIDTKRDLVADAGRPVPQIVPSVPAPAAVQPVRPRRVTSGGAALGGAAHAVSTQSVDEDEVALQPQENFFAEDQKPSFSDFAEQLGAQSVSELIEAAGVYCTLVLDRPTFTRPLLFQQLATIDTMGDLNPEDGLIGFGRLLRDGRIQKSARGQFALSTTSPLLTEAKRIAG